jgi:hypothetical protein
MHAGPLLPEHPPADLHRLDPATVELSAGSLLFRVYGERFTATAFNPGHGADARFHFLHDAEGRRIPSLYAAATPAAALAETVFHDVPVRPATDRRVSFHKLRGRVLSAIETRETLQLVQLHHPGISRLGLRPRDLTDTDPSEYPRTRAWAQALHDCGSHAGLVWTSRLHNTHKAYAFFGDRVPSRTFAVADGPLALWHGPGLDRVYEHAEAAGVTIVHP